MSKPTFTDEFKQGVVQYVLEHPKESKVAIAKRFSVADSTIHKWMKDAAHNNGTINSRGSGNYSSDESKEIARLKRELRDTQDALDVLHQRRAESKRLLAYWANNKAGNLLPSGNNS